MKADVIRVVQTYIDAVKSNDSRALPLHADFEFISPLGKYTGSVSFRNGLADFVKILKGIRVIRITYHSASLRRPVRLGRRLLRSAT
jgi:hypothetical protein